jgi:oligoribonuclease NrnB/cAMP/cGMP phosphodiesterase (DHH superfamily)
MGLKHDVPMVIFHSPCMDGFTAAWAIWLKHPDWEFVPGVHGIAPPDVEGRTVYMVDFSYKRPVLKELLAKAAFITIIDHHASAEKDLDGLMNEFENVRTVFDMAHSGAALTWEVFHAGKPAPYFVRVVEDRDLWLFNLPDTRSLCNVIFSYDYSFPKWNEFSYDLEDPLARNGMLVQGDAIERKASKDTFELTKALKERMVIGGQEVWAVNLPYTFASDAGHLLSEGQPFAATYWKQPNGWYFGLRSKPDGLDVSEIAKQYGGGGHKNSAGFNIKSLTEL